jgi:hypothetical protein
MKKLSFCLGDKTPTTCVAGAWGRTGLLLVGDVQMADQVEHERGDE